MNISDLSDIYGLFVTGMAVGIVMSAFPFIIGYSINFVFSLINKNT